MITFDKRMDPFSQEIKRDHVPIGFIQWHPGREPQVILHDSKGGYLTRAELRQCEAKFQEIFPPAAAEPAPPPETAPPLPDSPAVKSGDGINPSVLGHAEPPR